MPDPTPIPSASALARAVEASERNRDEIWNEAIEAAESRLAGLLRLAEGKKAKETDSIGAIIWDHSIMNFQNAMMAIRALRRDTPDAG